MIDLLAFFIAVAVLIGAVFVVETWLGRRAEDRRRYRDWADRLERELDNPRRHD
jgi:hypothetical protein